MFSTIIPRSRFFGIISNNNDDNNDNNNNNNNNNNNSDDNNTKAMVTRHKPNTKFNIIQLPRRFNAENDKMFLF